MPSKVGRNYLNLCFTKIKRPIASQSSSMAPAASHTTDHDRSRPFASAASSFIRNYNSLYEYTFDNPTSKSFSSSTSFSDDDDPDADITADFVTAFTSHRFFFSTPGRSNSIVESTITAESTTSSSSSSSTTTTPSESRNLLFNNSVAIPIPTYSPDPYADFRRSMQEMVEAREQMEVERSSWEFLHELLLCYLALNPKSTHKYILGAFADLTSFIKPPAQQPKAVEDGGDNPESESGGGGCEISGLTK